MGMIKILVAPHMGAWIEIYNYINTYKFVQRRTPHGCVDWNQICLDLDQTGEYVAPHMGAWIEIKVRV